MKVWITNYNGSAQESYSHQVPETPAGGVNFDFSDLAVAMAPSPRPRVQSTSRVGTNVNIQTFPEAIPGDAASLATVTGCNIRSTSSPSRQWILPAYYPTIVATVPFSGGSCAAANFAVDCSTTVDNWLVYQIVTDAGPDPFVGPATRVNCNPALADPKKIIPKKTAVELRN